MTTIFGLDAEIQSPTGLSTPNAYHHHHHYYYYILTTRTVHVVMASIQCPNSPPGNCAIARSNFRAILFSNLSATAAVGSAVCMIGHVACSQAANNHIKLVSPVIRVPALHFCHCQNTLRSANFRRVLPESENAYPLDSEPETDFNGKCPFKVIQGHLFRCQ